MNFLAWLERVPFGQLLALLLIAWAEFMAVCEIVGDPR
jgi:hypothetical protein